MADTEFHTLLSDESWARGDDDQFDIVGSSVTIRLMRRGGSAGLIEVVVDRAAYERARAELVERAKEWWPDEAIDAALLKVLGSDLTEGYLSAAGRVSRLEYEGGVFIASGDREEDVNGERTDAVGHAPDSPQRGIFFLGPGGPEGVREGRGNPLKAGDLGLSRGDKNDAQADSDTGGHLQD